MPVAVSISDSLRREVGTRGGEPSRYLKYCFYDKILILKIVFNFRVCRFYGSLHQSSLVHGLVYFSVPTYHTMGDLFLYLTKSSNLMVVQEKN
jgi:hypothetical protein